MPDIRSFFGGGGGGGGSSSPAASDSARSTPASPAKSPAKRKQPAGSRTSNSDKPSSSSSSRSRGKKADVEDEAAEEKEAPSKRAAGKVKVTDGKAGERKAAAASASKKGPVKQSSYYENFDDDDDDDGVFVDYAPSRKRSAAKAKHSAADDEEDEEYRDDSSHGKRASSRAKSPAAKSTRSSRSSRHGDDDDEEFVVDDEEEPMEVEEEEDEEYDDNEQPGSKERTKGAAASKKKQKRKNVLVDEDERMEEEQADGGEEGDEAKEEVKEKERAKISKHFSSTTSQKQRLKEEKRVEDEKKAEEDAKRAEREATAAVEREKERKAQALKDKRRMGVVDEETAMKDLEGSKPNTSVPVNAKSQRSGVRKAEIDPTEFFSDPSAAKAKLSAKSDNESRSAKDRAHAVQQKVDVVDIDDLEDDVPLESAASIKQKAADKQRKQEEESLRLARQLQDEADKQTLRPPLNSTPKKPNASPKRGAEGSAKKATPTKRVKREEEDEDEEEGGPSSAKKQKTATPAKKPVMKMEREEKEVKKEMKREDKKSAPAASKASKAAADEDNSDPYAEVKPEKKKWNPYLARQQMDNRPATLGMVKDPPVGAEGCLLGLAFVMTGVLDSLERDAAQTLIERYGGRITGSVSGKTDYLLMGQDPGESKKKKAEQLKTKIVDEDGLFELIRSRKGANLSSDQALKAKAAAAKTNKAASAAQQSAVGVTAAINTATSKGQEQLRVHGKVAERAQDMLWVEKHRPLRLTDIIGNAGLVKRLGDFLVGWDSAHLHAGKADKDNPKAILISGAPGLGKSTSASLVAREKGFHVVEYNASDVRNKSALDSVVGHLVANHGVDEYFSNSTPLSSSTPSSSSTKGKAVPRKKTVLIMDEVDGIAGNEDRGGLQQLVQIIKRSRIPIVCIANDASSAKMKTLKAYTLHLTWRRPTTEQIVPRMAAIAAAEGLAVDVNAMRKLIESTQADIRQCINFLQMYGKTHKKLTFDMVATNSNEAGGGGKDFDVGVFTVVPSFFRDPGRKAGWMDARSDLYFVDTGMVPLFVQELYLKGKARLVGSSGGGQKGKSVSAEKTAKLLECDAMDVVSAAADFIGGADTMNAVIYQEQDYSFMPVHAVMSSVAPGYLMSASGVQGGMSFPTWFGQNSSRTKRQRLIREMKMAMSLAAPASFTDYVTDYLPQLRTQLIEPFKQHSTDEAVSGVCEVLDALGLVRDDWDTLVEVTDDLVPPKDKVGLEGAVKRRFTAEWKKGEHKIRVRRGELKADRGGAGGGGLRVGADEVEDEDGAVAGEEEAAGGEEAEEGKESEDVKKDPMIQEAKGSASKGKGRGGGGAARGGAARGGRGKGRGGAAASGKGEKAAASKGTRGGKKGRGGGARKKGGKEERSEDDDDDDDEDMADFIDDDDE